MARTARRLVICIDNSGYEVSLERRKIYVCIPDARAEKLGQLRVIDESGEEYPVSPGIVCDGRPVAPCTARRPSSRIIAPRRQVSGALGGFPRELSR